MCLPLAETQFAQGGVAVSWFHRTGSLVRLTTRGLFPFLVELPVLALGAQPDQAGLGPVRADRIRDLPCPTTRHSQVWARPAVFARIVLAGNSPEAPIGSFAGLWLCRSNRGCHSDKNGARRAREKPGVGAARRCRHAIWRCARYTCRATCHGLCAPGASRFRRVLHPAPEALLPAFSTVSVDPVTGSIGRRPSGAPLYHRGSQFGPPDRRKLDRNLVARLVPGGGPGSPYVHERPARRGIKGEGLGRAARAPAALLQLSG